MIITKKKAIAERVKNLRLHGLSRDAWKRYSMRGKYKSYDIFEPGFKYNLININAALGINQLKKVEIFLEKRKKIWDFYNKSLIDLPIKLPPKIPKNYKHAYHLYTIVLDKKKTKKTREEITAFLQKNQIGIGIHYNAIQSFKFYKDKVKFKKMN